MAKVREVGPGVYKALERVVVRDTLVAIPGDELTQAQALAYGLVETPGEAADREAAEKAAQEAADREAAEKAAQEAASQEPQEAPEAKQTAGKPKGSKS